jgi:hypothetical protein
MRWFIPLFIGGWLAMSCLLSLLGGWYRLARRFRGKVRGSGKLYPFASIGVGQGFGPVTYSHCAFVRFDDSGVSISVFPAFRFFHPPLFIPWNAIAACQRERFFFRKTTAIYFPDTRIRIRFVGKVGRDIYLFRHPAA